MLKIRKNCSLGSSDQYCRFVLCLITLKQFVVFADAEWLSKKEVKIQERENKIRARRDARIAAEKAEANRSEFVFDCMCLAKLGM